ncbi:hypothetical protein QQ045_031204 [Rhodiola kirilowii]
MIGSRNRFREIGVRSFGSLGRMSTSNSPWPYRSELSSESNSFRIRVWLSDADDDDIDTSAENVKRSEDGNIDEVLVEDNCFVLMGPPTTSSFLIVISVPQELHRHIQLHLVLEISFQATAHRKF